MQTKKMPHMRVLMPEHQKRLPAKYTRTALNCGFRQIVLFQFKHLTCPDLVGRTETVDLTQSRGRHSV